MIGERRVLGIIVARGGSKGLPRKNVQDLGGKPLVAWSVAAGLGSRFLDRLILSTDDTEIMEAARAAGCEVPFARPPELAGDTARVQDAVLHALDALAEPFDYVVLLQATSPLRRTDDIDATIELCHRADANSATTVTPAAKPPYWTYFVDPAGHMERVVEPPAEINRRQDARPMHTLNGAVYVVRTEWFRQALTFVDKDTLAHSMPA